MPFLVEEKEEHGEDDEGDRKEGHEGIEADLFPMAHVEKNQTIGLLVFRPLGCLEGNLGYPWVR